MLYITKLNHARNHVGLCLHEYHDNRANNLTKVW